MSLHVSRIHIHVKLFKLFIYKDTFIVMSVLFLVKE